MIGQKNMDFATLVASIPNQHFQTVLRTKYSGNVEAAEIAILIFDMVGGKLEGIESRLESSIKRIDSNVKKLFDHLDITEEDPDGRLGRIERKLDKIIQHLEIDVD